MSGSLLSGRREQDRIAFIVPFEVSTLFQRLSYSHVPTVNREDGGKPEAGRTESGRAAASKTMEAMPGHGIKPGQRSDHTHRRTESHDEIECGVQNQMSKLTSTDEQISPGKLGTSALRQAKSLKETGYQQVGLHSWAPETSGAEIYGVLR